jgi:hypothetical protein
MVLSVAILLPAALASSVMTYNCGQQIVSAMTAGNPSVAYCLSGSSSLTTKCGQPCISAFNSFSAQIATACSGQTLLNLGNGAEIRTDTISKYFTAITAITCQVSPQDTSKFCLNQLLLDINQQVLLLSLCKTNSHCSLWLGRARSVFGYSDY